MYLNGHDGYLYRCSTGIEKLPAWHELECVAVQYSAVQQKRCQGKRSRSGHSEPGNPPLRQMTEGQLYIGPPPPRSVGPTEPGGHDCLAHNVTAGGEGNGLILH